MKKNRLIFSYLLLVIMVILQSCSYENLSKDRKQPPPKGWFPPEYDSFPIDSVFVENEKFCFPSINFCFDSIDIISKSYISNSADYGEFKNPKIFYRTTVTNIFPLDLDKVNDSIIINRFLKMLEIENAFHSAVILKQLQRQMLDSFDLKTSYFFDFSKKNKIHAIDTLNYSYISDEKKGYLELIIELYMDITGDYNLNQIKLKYSEMKYNDHVVHLIKSTNKYCNNLKFDLKFIVYDENYFNQKDFLPNYMFIR